MKRIVFAIILLMGVAQATTSQQAMRDEAVQIPQRCWRGLWFVGKPACAPLSHWVLPSAGAPAIRFVPNMVECEGKIVINYGCVSPLGIEPPELEGLPVNRAMLGWLLSL